MPHVRLTHNLGQIREYAYVCVDERMRSFKLTEIAHCQHNDRLYRKLPDSMLSSVEDIQKP